MSTPTTEMSAELQAAFDHFNVDLYGGILPAPLLTLQRQKMTPGYFTPTRFANRKSNEHVDELALNPSYFAVQSLFTTLKNLVLQMNFCWQFHFGQPGRRRYCNKQYSDKLMEIGLHPSLSGKPGGKITGEKIDAYVIDGGLFEQSCNRLLTKEFALSWLDRFPIGIKQLAETLHQLPEETRIALTEQEVSAMNIVMPVPEPASTGQTRYHCPLCMARVWGKQGLTGQLMHMPCALLMIAGDIAADPEN